MIVAGVLGLVLGGAGRAWARLLKVFILAGQLSL